VSKSSLNINNLLSDLTNLQDEVANLLIQIRKNIGDPDKVRSLTYRLEELLLKYHTLCYYYSMDKKKLHTKTKKTSSKTFVFSTPDIDRDGDRVLQNWDLDDFIKNPIVLAFHDHTNPVGKWINIRVQDGMLQGDLELAEVGTSDFINSLHKLVEQDILKSVSVGFRSKKSKANTFGGYDLDENYLFECSLVSIPANQNALAKEFSYLSNDEVKRICTMNGDCSSTKAGDNNLNIKTKSIKRGFKAMTIQERIAAAQGKMAVKSAELNKLNAKDDLSDADVAKMSELSDEIKTLTGRIEQFEAIEVKAAGGVVETVVAAEEKLNEDEAKSLVFKGIVTTIKAFGAKISPVAAAELYYADTKGLKDLVKAATDPATTTDAEWAGNLVQQGYDSFLETLYPMTVYGRVGGRKFEFGKARSVIIPARKAGADVSGGFVGEGQPIPVKEDAFVTQTLTPKKMAVITTFTAEILKSSTPNVEQIVRTDILEDTAKAIDAAFLDNAAVAGLPNPRPAGLQNATATGAGNINAATGTDIAAIEADLDAAMDRMGAVELGQSGVIVMNPKISRHLRRKTNALGQYPLKDGLVDGFTIVTSTNVPDDVVFLIDDRAMSFGTDFAPQFEVSTQATVVMANPAEPIGNGSAVTALPVRSMFQTDTTALRFKLGMDWSISRLGGVQVITGVAW